MANGKIYLPISGIILNDEFMNLIESYGSYAHMVDVDSGVIINRIETFNFISYLNKNNLFNNLVFSVNNDGGLKLNDINGTDHVQKAYDLSDNSNHIEQTTASKQPKLTLGGFKGDGDVVGLDGGNILDGMSAMTFICWVKFNRTYTTGSDFNLGMTLVVKGADFLVGNTNQVYSIGWDTRSDRDNINFFHTPEDGESNVQIFIDDMSTKVSTGDWVMITGTWDGATTTHRIYLNENIEGEELNGNATMQVLSDRNFHLMGNTARSLDGTITNVMMFNKALSAAEITDLYNYTKHKYE